MDFKRPTTSFGEKLLFVPTGKRDSRLSGRFLPGVFSWYGIASERRDDGVVVEAPSFPRLPEAERQEPELLLKVRGVLWAPSGGKADPNVAVILDPVVALEHNLIQLHWSLYLVGKSAR